MKITHPLLTPYTIFIQTMVLQCPNYRFPNATFSGLCVHGTKYNRVDPTRAATCHLYLKIITMVQRCAITKISIKVSSGTWTSLSRTLSHRIIFNLPCLESSWIDWWFLSFPKIDNLVFYLLFLKSLALCKELPVIQRCTTSSVSFNPWVESQALSHQSSWTWGSQMAINHSLLMRIVSYVLWHSDYLTMAIPGWISSILLVLLVELRLDKILWASQGAQWVKNMPAMQGT